MRDFPETVGLWQAQENIGQLFNAALQIPCPFIVSFHIRPEEAERSAAKAQMHFMNKDSTANEQGLAQAHASVRAAQQNAFSQISMAAQLINQTQVIEQMLSGELSTQLSDTLQWADKLRQ